MTDTPLVSIVFISYKRFNLLKQTYDSFKKICKYPNLELILSDDGSPKEIQNEMRGLFFHKYLFSPRNFGLGNNQNKGITAAEGSYILNLQDDWFCHGPSDFIEVCLTVFDELPDVGYIRLWQHPSFSIPYDVRKLKNGLSVRVYDDKRGMDKTKNRYRDYIYSDRPHIKRRTFHEQIGLYREDLVFNDMEIDFCQRVEQQDAIKGAWIEGYGDIFEHIGIDHTFNPSQRRANLRAWLENHRLLRYPWQFYLLLRYGKK